MKPIEIDYEKLSDLELLDAVVQQLVDLGGEAMDVELGLFKAMMSRTSRNEDTWEKE